MRKPAHLQPDTTHGFARSTTWGHNKRGLTVFSARCKLAVLLELSHCRARNVIIRVRSATQLCGVTRSTRLPWLLTQVRRARRREKTDTDREQDGHQQPGYGPWQRSERCRYQWPPGCRRLLISRRWRWQWQKRASGWQDAAHSRPARQLIARSYGTFGTTSSTMSALCVCCGGKGWGRGWWRGGCWPNVPYTLCLVLRAPRLFCRR